MTPGVLVQPALLPGLPETLEAGLLQAEAANPGLAASRLTAMASGADVATARAAWFPTVAVEGSIGAIGPLAPWRGSSYDRAASGTLDVLIADENLRAAQVSRALSRHDTIVAEASLLAATGRLEARRLLPGEPLYDPQAAFRRVRRAGAVPWEGAISRLDRGG